MFLGAYILLFFLLFLFFRQDFQYLRYSMVYVILDNSKLTQDLANVRGPLKNKGIEKPPHNKSHEIPTN